MEETGAQQRRACPRLFVLKRLQADQLVEGIRVVAQGDVLMKLGVRDRVQAVVLAYESGVVAPGSMLSE